MVCPGCQSANIKQCRSTTVLGYCKYRCRSCDKQYNERTETPYNYIQYTTEVVTLALYLYYRFRNSLDDVVELMALRGFSLSHQTIHNWSQTFGVAVGIKMRENRYGKAGLKWHTDATSLRIEGRWCYLYRAIDKKGNLEVN